jgi:hypothetical protein
MKRLATGDLTFCESTHILTFKYPRWIYSEHDENRVVFVQFEAGNFETRLILPTFLNDSFCKVHVVLLSDARVYMCFEGSNVLLLTPDYKVNTMFHIDEPSRIVAVKENRSNADIVCFQFEKAIHILNLKAYTVVAHLPAQLFEWRYSIQFVIYDGNQLQLRTLKGEVLLNFVVHVLLGSILGIHRKLQSQ